MALSNSFNKVNSDLNLPLSLIIRKGKNRMYNSYLDYIDLNYATIHEINFTSKNTNL